MIKKIFLLSALALFIFACGDETENDNDNPSDTSEIAALEEIVEIAMADFESKAGELIGKEVKVSGVVDHVCKHDGKKIHLVNGDNSLHVSNDKRFDESLSGSEISVTGIVEEEKVDEIYLTEWWDHVLESHSEGTDSDKEILAKVEEEIQQIRDSLKTTGVEYFPEYSLKYVSHKEKIN